jgi:hypothetical protein
MYLNYIIIKSFILGLFYAKITENCIQTISNIQWVPNDTIYNSYHKMVKDKLFLNEINNLKNKEILLNNSSDVNSIIEANNIAIKVIAILFEQNLIPKKILIKEEYFITEKYDNYVKEAYNFLKINNLYNSINIQNILTSKYLEDVLIITCEKLVKYISTPYYPFPMNYYYVSPDYDKKTLSDFIKFDKYFGFKKNLEKKCNFFDIKCHRKNIKYYISIKQYDVIIKYIFNTFNLML